MVTTRSSSRERSGKKDEQDASPARPPADESIQPPPLSPRKPSPPPHCPSASHSESSSKEDPGQLSLLDPPLTINCSTSTPSLPQKRSSFTAVKNPYIITSPKRANQITPSSLSLPSVSKQSILSIDDALTSHSAYVQVNRSSSDVASLALGATNVSDGYFYRRKKAVNNFLEGLRSLSPKYDHLLEPTAVPPTFNTKEKSVPSLFVLLSGKDDKHKKKVLLSDMLIDWVSQLRRDPPIKLSTSSDSDEPNNSAKKKQHGENNCDEGSSNNTNHFLAPSTINTYVRTLLSAGREYYGWDFSMKEDLGFDGGYTAFFTRLCQTRQKQDVSFVVCLCAVAKSELCHLPFLLCVSLCMVPKRNPVHLTLGLLRRLFCPVLTRPSQNSTK